MKGIVVNYKEDKGYGFIRTNEFDKDIFFHIKNILNSNKIRLGQEVNFEIERTKKGVSAKNIIAGKTDKKLRQIYIISLLSLSLLLILLYFFGINIILAYFISINLGTFFIYGYDKKIAGGTKFRIPEIFLHLLAILGGSITALMSQQIFRHKTKKLSFKIITPLTIIIQGIILISIAR